MFFMNGERLIIQGNNLHRDYQRYNQLARGLFTSKVGEISVENAYRRGDTFRTGSPKAVELSLWRVTDRNTSAWERGFDGSEFVTTKPNGERISYVLVPRMNTDANDPFPTEYTREKDATFEDVNDPRTIVIARAYKGVVAEIAKDFVLKNEEELRSGYKFLSTEREDEFYDFSNPLFLKAITEQAVQIFEPNVYQYFMNGTNQGQSRPDSTFYIDPIVSVLTNQNQQQDLQQVISTAFDAPENIAEYDEFIDEVKAAPVEVSSDEPQFTTSTMQEEPTSETYETSSLDIKPQDTDVVAISKEPIVIAPVIAQDFVQ